MSGKNRRGINVYSEYDASVSVRAADISTQEEIDKHRYLSFSR